MKFPKLKQALLCRILTYVVVLGVFLVPIVTVLCLPFLHEGIKAVVSFALMVALLIYLFQNAAVLIAMDMALAWLRCMLTAGKSYPLPARYSVQAIKKRIGRFGRGYDPSYILPRPAQLRYRFCSSATVFAKGIEKVVASYEVDFLDAEQYRAIFSSANANSKALIGKKMPRFLDASQKKAPLNRITVIVILAKRVDSPLWDDLYERVCKQEGDGFEQSVVPCVVDLERGQCVFNSLRLPYTGFGYPVKNRGIRLVKRLVFGGHLPAQKERIPVQPDKDIDLEDTLWNFWRELAAEMKGSDKKAKKRMAAMTDRQILLEDELLYLKWGERAVCLWAEQDAQNKTATVEAVTHWSYPKSQPISKKTIQELRSAITSYFGSQSYTVIFEEEN